MQRNRKELRKVRKRNSITYFGGRSVVFGLWALRETVGQKKRESQLLDFPVFITHKP
jgi:hypothetical protein